MKDLAPIILFCYNRPSHTLRTIEALQKNHGAKESELFIFCDGPKSEADQLSVTKVHEIVDNVNGFKSVKVEKSESNKGLADSIIEGVTKIIAKFGKAIVLEDDLVTSPYFLEFMNGGLDFYQNDDRVASIHGYFYPVKEQLPETFFLKGADCWGWATWKRGWDLFNENGQELLDQLKRRNLTKEFDFDGSYDYTKMLEGQIAGKNNSWAIRWHACAYLADKLTLYPGKTLVQNIGFDNSGTHCDKVDKFDHDEYFNGKIAIRKVFVAENKTVREFVKSFFKPKKNRPIKKYIKKQQFHPDILGLLINPFYFARRGLCDAMKYFSGHVKGDVLDIDCGQKPYSKMFDCNNYIGLKRDSPENRKSKDVDSFYDGKTFPFENEEFDSVLCNQVLEHSFDPDQFLGEIHRVMKKDANLLLTAPFIWYEREQTLDYARYSSFGLRYLLEKSGFEVIAMKKTMNGLPVIFQLINVYIYKKIAKNSRVNRTKKIAISIFTGFFNILGSVISFLTPKSDDLYLDNIVLARKKLK